MNRDQAPHQHARILAGTNSAGRPVYEEVPVAGLPDGRYRIVGTPALVPGCAADDIIVLDGDGRPEVIKRGGNLALQAVPTTPFSPAEVALLAGELDPLGGLVESPAHGRFLVVTMPASAGFPRIESIMAEWSAAANAQWTYGNVFDDEGAPLNWW